MKKGGNLGRYHRDPGPACLVGTQVRPALGNAGDCTTGCGGCQGGATYDRGSPEPAFLPTWFSDVRCRLYGSATRGGRSRGGEEPPAGGQRLKEDVEGLALGVVVENEAGDAWADDRGEAGLAEGAGETDRGGVVGVAEIVERVPVGRDALKSNVVVKENVDDGGGGGDVARTQSDVVLK